MIGIEINYLIYGILIGGVISNAIWIFITKYRVNKLFNQFKKQYGVGY